MRLPGLVQYEEREFVCVVCASTAIGDYHHCSKCHNSKWAINYCSCGFALVHSLTALEHIGWPIATMPRFN